jgi:predicted short-subunit dehydrogenase-like oxidoreductase (DUF2520 family)
VKSVSIIGPGRVGGAIALGLSGVSYSITNLFFRSNPEAADALGRRINGSSVREFESSGPIASDIIFITTQDPQIQIVAEELASRITVPAMVFHTSGALSSSVLDKLTGSIGCSTGSIHPLISISTPDKGVGHFEGSYFCIEGMPDAVSEAQQIVAALGGVPFTIDTEYKTLYHAAAVTACGHLVALFDAAVEMMGNCGLEEPEAKKILLPLVNSTVHNLNEQSTATALTGTFARADVETFVRHLQALNKSVSDDLLEIYLLLGERSLEIAAKQGISADRIESLRTKVAIAKSKLKW